MFNCSCEKPKQVPCIFQYTFSLTGGGGGSSRDADLYFHMYAR